MAYLEPIIYSAGAVGVSAVIAHNWYKIRRKDNETNPETIKAFKELFESEGFNKYIEVRAQTSKDIIDKVLAEGGASTGQIKKMIDSACGKLPEIINS